jgi:serine/threonine-protein kinase
MGTANAIISETQAPMSLHSQEIPLLLQYVANKMLAKEPGRRYQLAHEVRRDLEQLSDSGETEAKLFQAAGVGAEKTRRVWRWVVPLMLASVVFAALLGWYLKPSVVPRLNRLVVALPAGQQLPQSGSVFALSPDGTLLVYVGVSAGRRQLYLRPLNSFEVIVIEGTEGASCPFFSPDGRWVGFFADRKLKKLSLNEGLVVDLCDAAEPWGATWTPDDNIIFATGRTSPLFRVAAKGGGTPEVFSIPNREKGEYGHIWPQRVECRRAIVYEVDIPAPASDLVAIRTSVDTEGGS